MTSHKHFVNREISWLNFNQRVLAMACDPRLPALERLKFLAITASNLDEFFMVRIGGLAAMNQAGGRTRGLAGMTPAQQLAAIAKKTREMVARQYACFADLFQNVLPECGLLRVDVNQLTASQETCLRELVHDEWLPVLTPMLLDPAEDPGASPALRALVLYIAVRIAPGEGEENERLAVIPVASPLSRTAELPGCDGQHLFLFIEDGIKKFVARWFPGKEILETACFRVTRNADIALQENEAPDLMIGMEGILAARKEAECIRIELEHTASAAMESLLLGRLGSPFAHLYRIDGIVGLDCLMGLASLDGFEALKFEPWQPQASPLIDRSRPLFEQIREGDLLLHHPYETYNPVVRFIQEAADDPEVLAIKQILYRTSSDSRVVAALKRAAGKGKYVTVLVELKARFDEARNIEWARALEQAGVQVIYGVKGLKTHAKICLVIRREAGGIVRYVHFGTGNYNENTARLYSDISYLTRRPDLGADASLVFNAICGYSQPVGLHRLCMAPFGLREKLLELIEGEIQRAAHGLTAQINAKMNALVDPVLIEKLYEASRAGVRIRLNVRGVCCLRPGVAGLSENIRVNSIVGRHLEHARILHFRHGGEDLVFISSADWMPRNLDRRVELLVPVEDSRSKERLMHILKLYVKDSVQGWQIGSNGENHPPQNARSRLRKGSQELLQQEACSRIDDIRKRRPTALEPHLPA